MTDDSKYDILILKAGNRKTGWRLSFHFHDLAAQQSGHAERLTLCLGETSGK
jgi:hypothetical protein